MQHVQAKEEQDFYPNHGSASQDPLKVYLSSLRSNHSGLCRALYYCTRTRHTLTEEVVVLVHLFANPGSSFRSSIWSGYRQLPECIHTIHKQKRWSVIAGQTLWELSMN